MLRSPSHLEDPYPLYGMLRDSGRVRLPTGDVVLSRYAEVAGVLKDAQFGKRPVLRSPFRSGRVLFRMFLLLDPPDHTRLRRVVAPAFTPSAVAALRPAVTAIAERLLPSESRPIDLIGEFAYPLPLEVIGELLGIPPVDRPQIAAWARTLTASLDNPVPVRLRELPRAARDIARGRSHPVAAVRAATRIVDYTRQHIAAATNAPTTELVERLVQAERDGALNADEAAATWIMMAIAGHETTANLIGNSVFALVDHPEVFATVRDDTTLIDRLVDECLRYDSPVPYTARIANENTTLNGLEIERGQSMVVFMAAANRDPDPFPNPDCLDLTRPATPPHLGFAYGIHFCVGSALAKVEAEIALTTLLPRLALKQDRGTITRRPSVTVRGLATFPIQLASPATT